MRIIIAAAALAGAATLAHAQAPEQMTANVSDASGAAVGTVTFAATASGFVVVTAEFDGLPAGVLGFHVHETGVCDAADGFRSAGGHYAGGHEHGVHAAGGIHAGDFPNLHVPESGALTVEYFTDRLSLGAEGENPLADADGSAVVVHASADDYTSQPAGNAGDRIACGVIE